MYGGGLSPSDLANASTVPLLLHALFAVVIPMIVSRVRRQLMFAEKSRSRRQQMETREKSVELMNGVCEIDILKLGVVDTVVWDETACVLTYLLLYTIQAIPTVEIIISISALLTGASSK